MNQLSIDLPFAATHRNDPSSSHEAESKVRKSDRMKHQCEQVFQAIKACPNCTAGELSDRSGIDYQIIQRRVSILERNGLIKRQGKRVCSVNHTSQTVWGVDI